MTEDHVEGPDLVVAGAGGGVVAALRAAERGLSVLLIDADQYFRHGNNTSMSTAMIPAVGTRFQQAAGIEDSPARFLGDISAKTGGDFNRIAASALAEVSAELIEWLADSIHLDLDVVTDFSYPGHSVSRCHSIPGRSGSNLLSALLDALGRHQQIDLMTPAKLVDARLTDGHIAAAVIETPAGVEVIPTRAILLATNGYGADRDLVRRHIPEIAEAHYFGGEHSRGDALRIGGALGAATDYLDSYQGHAGLATPSASLATWATVMHGGFLVNTSGERYGNETSGYSEYAAQSLKHAAAGSFIIIDERIYDACQSFQDFRDVVSGGGVKWGETPEELATTCRIDPVGLARTVQETLEYADGEADPHGRTHWEAPLDGRLAGIRVKPALFHTQGGLRVDNRARVMKEDGRVIGGLYASGGAAAGISGHGAAGYLAGNGLLPALGLAYLAANDIPLLGAAEAVALGTDEQRSNNP